MSKNDAVVRELMAKVEDQKKSLGAKPRSVLVTNGVFKKNAQEFFNLNTVNEVTPLVQSLAFLLSQQDYYEKACVALDVKGSTFMWDGYTVDEWKEDFQLRKDVIAYNARKKQLDTTLAKLKSLMSEDARTADELDAIKSALLGL